MPKNRLRKASHLVKKYHDSLGSTERRFRARILGKSRTRGDAEEAERLAGEHQTPKEVS